MREHIITKITNLQLKNKLILVFVLVSLIPTVSLVYVSHFIITQSINRWESVSAKLRDLSVLHMSDKALELASDSGMISALEGSIDFLEVDLNMPEDYILMVYNTAGERVFSTSEEPVPEIRLDTLAETGLPSINEFIPWQPVTTREIKLKNEELVLAAAMSQSQEAGRALGIVVIERLIPSAPADIGSETVIAILMFSAILILIIALWISSLIAKEITEPIQKLVTGTREVAGGNLDHQVNIHARDEVGMLADSFDRMTRMLRSSAEELKRVEKTAAWREIAQILAHEIKNPLTPIQLSAERLRRRYYSKREGYEQILDECTDNIINEVERVRRLLDEFSRMARMPVVKPVPSNINSIIERALRLYGEFPENVEVKAEYAQDLPEALADPEQMEQAFFNIIKNAVEAMNGGGRLTVSTRATLSSENKCIEVEFADTGPGVSAESMEKLFTPHFSTKKGGSGLGLAIVKKIITDHGGDVTAKSEEGKGAVFTFKIPVAKGA